MTIVQINGSYGNADSTGRTTKEMHKWLTDHGEKSYCFVTKYNDGAGNEEGVYLFGNKISFKLHALLSRIFGLQGYFSHIETKKMIGKIKECNPDIVILRVLHSNCIHFPQLFSYLSKNNIPVVVVLHDCFFFTGHCVFSTIYNCTKWKESCSGCPGIRESNPSWFFDTSAKCHRDKIRWFSSVKRVGVIGVSEWVTGEAEKSFLGRHAKIARIYNWIDLKAFRPKERGEIRERHGYGMDEKIMLGVASLWSEAKGLSCVLKTAREFPNCTVLLIGRMPQDAGGLPSNIKCIGTISDINVLADYYSLADIFINPSTHETFGKTTAEAISCGTPVVAYQTTACIELVGADRGYCAKFGDTEDFLCGIRMILERGKQSYLDALMSFSRENFDMGKNMEAYMEFFGELLKWE